MPISSKRLVISTLKDLAKRTLREQLHLKRVIAARHELVSDETATRQRIMVLKGRIDRELVTHAGTLGLPKLQAPPQDEDESVDS